MSIKYLPLGRSRRKIREIALKHYLNNSDPNKAIEEATKEIRTGSIIGAILIGLAVKLIVELIWYWFNNKISQPSMFYSPGEPGN